MTNNEAAGGLLPNASSEELEKVDYSQSSGLINSLVQLNCSVAISSYQSGFLYHLGCDPKGGLHLHRAAMAKPMGLSYDGVGGLTLAGGSEIIQFKNEIGRAHVRTPVTA